MTWIKITDQDKIPKEGVSVYVCPTDREGKLFYFRLAKIEDASWVEYDTNELIPYYIMEYAPLEIDGKTNTKDYINTIRVLADSHNDTFKRLESYIRDNKHIDIISDEKIIDEYVIQLINIIGELKDSIYKIMEL